MKTFKIADNTARFRKIYLKCESGIPAELFTAPCEKPDLSAVVYPLPSRKKDYTCFVKTEKALWLGAPNGLTRFDASAQNDIDKLMYFSAPRELNDNNVLHIYCDDAENESIWVETETAVTHIEMKTVTAEEKGDMMIEETVKYVDRHGMTSQKHMTIPRELDSVVTFGHCDNSGLFTSSFSVSELCRYAVLKKELGQDNPKTQEARKNAVRACEAALLLMYIHGRGDGFVARTYLTVDEPIPDEGYFYRRQGDKAVCLPTEFAKEHGYAGKVVSCTAPVPERLAKLYREEGYTDDEIIYKGDTSSDEITGHMTHIWFAHKILGPEDPELDALLINAAKATLGHIIDHGYRLFDADKPTTWARWDLDYFSQPIGWSDGCLNACQLLMYHKLVMDITGEEGRWKESYDGLLAKGYRELTAKHDARFHVSSKMDGGLEPVEELMYGDHTLATLAYGMIINLEKDEKIREFYRDGYRGWNATFRREHNPMYDLVFMYSCPDDEIDTDKLEQWFRGVDITRYGAAPSPASRYDMPVRTLFGGTKEFSWLLPNGEYFVSKHDRNPFEYQRDDTAGHTKSLLENAYLYTLPYWLGRFLGIIEK